MARRPRNRYLIPLVAALALLPAAIVAVPAGAAGSQTVKCIGNGDFCGVTIGIAGGASNKVITVNLTDTNFRRVGVRVTPPASKGAFGISKASFQKGGSQYKFTLNAVKSNPKAARIILLFAAGTPA
jgi:hypothetical protein